MIINLSTICYLGDISFKEGVFSFEVGFENEHRIILKYENDKDAQKMYNKIKESMEFLCYTIEISPKNVIETKGKI